MVVWENSSLSAIISLCFLSEVAKAALACEYIYTALDLADSVLASEGVRDTAGLVSCGIGPLATASCTLSEALCRMPIACWWVTV